MQKPMRNKLFGIGAFLLAAIILGPASGWARGLITEPWNLAMVVENSADMERSWLGASRRLAVQKSLGIRTAYPAPARHRRPLAGRAGRGPAVNRTVSGRGSEKQKALHSPGQGPGPFDLRHQGGRGLAERPRRRRSFADRLRGRTEARGIGPT